MRLNEFEFYPEQAFQPLGRRLTRFWGKDGTPPPDPRLIEAQIKSLGIQGDAINRMMAMADEMAPLQRQQLQQSIEQSAQLWSQNQEDRDFALGRRGILAGVQDRIVGESARFDEGERRTELAGRSDADVTQAFGAARQATDRDMARMGVNPNDGRSSATKGIMATQEALARVTGRKMAGDTARAERLQLDDRANNVLAGYPAMTMQAQSQGVGTMGAGINAVNAGVGGLIAPQQSIGSAAGAMGGNATNMWSAQQNAYAQDQQAGAAGAGALGSAVGSIGMAVAI